MGLRDDEQSEYYTELHFRITTCGKASTGTEDSITRFIHVQAVIQDVMLQAKRLPQRFAGELVYWAGDYRLYLAQDLAIETVEDDY